MPILLFFLTVLTRIPFISKYLYHMDSGHFAIALNHYNLTLHQPHPPGYFFYVMLGRATRLFVHDANVAFVFLSVVFSGLAVVAIYYLGKDLFDKEIGICAAMLALTSPNFWFHGEIALTYSIETFFSAVTGLFCWRALQGRKESLWISSAMVALAGGFRQNTTVFLLPIWLYSMKNHPFKRILSSLAIFGTILASWFVPMIIATGGMERYLEAFRELWLFSTGHNSVFEKGFPSLFLFSRTLHSFLFFSLSVLMPFMILAFYGLFRNRQFSSIFGKKTSFILCWILPSFLFYLLIFIHPANPGYVLILLPPLMIIGAVSLRYLASVLLIITGKNLWKPLATFVVLANAVIFLFIPLPTSRAEINAHDCNFEVLCTVLKAFSPKNTMLFVGPYCFYSYHQIMVYLPEFYVYQVDVRTARTGEKRKQFVGRQGTTVLTDTIEKPEDIEKFAAVFVSERSREPQPQGGIAITRIDPEIVVASGPFNAIYDIYPEVRQLSVTSSALNNGPPEESSTSVYGRYRKLIHDTRRPK